MKDYYEILGIAKTATTDEIKKAFKKKAFEYHPDRNAGNAEAEQKFKDANEAHQVLSDPDKRAEYDNPPSPDLGSMFGNFNPFDSANGAPSNLQDFLRHFTGDWAEEEQRRQPANVVPLQINLKDLINGSSRKLNLDLKCVCKECVGTKFDSSKIIGDCKACGGKGSTVTNSMFGRVSATCKKCNGSKKEFEACKNCNGIGTKTHNKDVEIKLPAGFRGGSVQMHAEVDGIPTLVIVEVSLNLPDDIVVDKTGNLVKTINVKLSDLILGNPSFPIENALGEKANFKLPPKTSSHQLIRIQGQGIPVHHQQHSSKRSDMLLKLAVEYPAALTDEQNKAVEAMKAVGL